MSFNLLPGITSHRPSIGSSSKIIHYLANSPYLLWLLAIHHSYSYEARKFAIGIHTFLHMIVVDNKTVFGFISQVCLECIPFSLLRLSMNLAFSHLSCCSIYSCQPLCHWEDLGFVLNILLFSNKTENCFINVHFPILKIFAINIECVRAPGTLL